jgi:hypothetical protein
VLDARSGRIEYEVVAAAATVDLIVLARDQDHPRHGPRSLGPTARYVVDHAPSAVLLVWPDTPRMSSRHETTPASPRRKEKEMNQQLICELNLALIPEAELASRHITFSRQMAGRYRSLIQLNGVTPKVAFTPHVTLYQVPVQAGDLPELHAALLNVAAKAPQLWLSATEYRSNQDEGSFEVRYAPATPLMELQAATIAVVNPLRGDLLLERDPAGRPLSERIDEPGLAGDNIRQTGFDAVGDPAQGGLFYPHVTLNWFELGTSVELNATDWPPLTYFDGRFLAFGIFLLGPYGTCAQRLAALPLAA